MLGSCSFRAAFMGRQDSLLDVHSNGQIPWWWWQRRCTRLGSIISIFHILAVPWREDVLFRRIPPLYQICHRRSQYLALLCEEKCFEDMLGQSGLCSWRPDEALESQRCEILCRDDMAGFHVWRHHVSWWAHSIPVLVHLHATHPHPDGRLPQLRLPLPLPADLRRRPQPTQHPPPLLNWSYALAHHRRPEHVLVHF